MKRVLVTGARGFVGRSAIRELSRAGWQVDAVTSGEPPPDIACTWHRADLLDPRARESLIASTTADALLHLAWCAKPPGYWTDPKNLHWLSASLDLVRLFTERGGRRAVGAGTCAEYDWNAGTCLEHSTPLLPTSLYGSTKAACGSVLSAYSRQTDLSAAWGRVFFLFGPGDDSSRLLPSLVKALDSGQPATCRTGSHVRDFIHVDDAAGALVALLESDVTGPVNIASGMPLPVGQFARAAAERTRHPGRLSVEDGPPEHAVVTADVTRLREEVGWRPSVDIMTRIHEAVCWWQACEPERLADRAT